MLSSEEQAGVYQVNRSGRRISGLRGCRARLGGVMCVREVGADQF